METIVKQLGDLMEKNKDQEAIIKYKDKLIADLRADLIKEKAAHVETAGMGEAQRVAREEELKELGAAQRELIAEQEAHQETKGELDRAMHDMEHVLRLEQSHHDKTKAALKAEGDDHQVTMNQLAAVRRQLDQARQSPTSNAAVVSMLAKVMEEKTALEKKLEAFKRMLE